MLHELRIKNLLLIDSLDLTLEPGFNVMTGETGAGKSIVIGALQLVLGHRASADLVRPTAEFADVQALFQSVDASIVRALGDGEACESHEEHEQHEKTDGTAHSARGNETAGTKPDHSEEDGADEVVVRRVVLVSNRSRAYVNGRLSTAQELTDLSRHLVDIASQHQSVSLTDAATHVAYLDAFGGLQPLHDEVAKRVDALHALHHRITELSNVAKHRAEQLDYVQYQLAQIDEVAPSPGELRCLQAERGRLRNSEKLTSTTSGALQQLSEDNALCDQLSRIVGELTVAAAIDDALAGTVSMARDALDHAIECSRSLQRYVENLQTDPQRLDEVEQRLFNLEKLLRLHGPTEQDVIDARQRLVEQLQSLQQVDDDLGGLRDRFERDLRITGELARELSSKRREAAGELAAKIGGHLASLGMGGAQVQVRVDTLAAQGDLSFDGMRLSRDGVDRVEFLIAPNKGIEPRPLRKIASGGELSRALLAIKQVLVSQGPAGLYVFDEVDAGVGGAVAERIGQALAAIAKHRQVLCITHLAPIAALADAHFVVQKHQEGNIARTDVVRVTGEQRVREVARMLSGKQITKASLQAAREMIGKRDPSLR